MAKSVKTISEETYQYVLDSSLRETKAQRELRELTNRTVEHHEMMSAPEQMQFIALLMQLMNAQHVIEVGVFTGYGTLTMAQALPEKGRLVACDINDAWPSVGQPFWEQAGVAEKIELRIAPALETLQDLLSTDQSGLYDLIYIDADKIHYQDYYELSLELLRPGGVIIFDNTLWLGEDWVPAQQRPASRAVHTLNQALHHDNRVNISLLPIAYGMTLVRTAASG